MSLPPSITPRYADYRRHVDEIVASAIAAADAEAAVGRFLARDGRTLLVGRQPDVERIDLDKGRVFLVATGKAAVPMARAAVRVAGDDLAGGIVIAKDQGENFAAEFSGQKVKVYTGGHPLPDIYSVAATKRVLEMLTGLEPEDSVPMFR